MKLIVGLGNPGREYEQSRHNVGFWVVDALARRWSVAVSRRRHEALCGSGVWEQERVALLKPQTYMNRSGQSVAAALGFYQASAGDLLVVVDDMALPLGQLRLRGQGLSGGHHGLADIIERLGREDFSRLRVGIGAAAPGTAVAYVLGRFTREEEAVMTEAVERAAEAAQCWLEKGLEAAMNRYNVKLAGAESEE